MYLLLKKAWRINNVPLLYQPIMRRSPHPLSRGCIVVGQCHSSGGDIGFLGQLSDQSRLKRGEQGRAKVIARWLRPRMILTQGIHLVEQYLITLIHKGGFLILKNKVNIF